MLDSTRCRCCLFVVVCGVVVFCLFWCLGFVLGFCVGLFVLYLEKMA